MSRPTTSQIDRLSIRSRPDGAPIMYQSWGKLLFMHWALPAEALRPFIPPRLELDTFQGKAWIAVTPFTIWNARPIFTPPLPWLSNFHEINVRTYVHLDGVPGVWFFSLDANSLVAVLAARTFFHLPYHSAQIELRQEGDTIFYQSSREDQSAAAALNATWRIGDKLLHAVPDTLEFFLVERYCLYTTHEGKLYRGRIFHPSWPLQSAELVSYQSSMIEAQGLPAPNGDPLVHYAEAIDVEIWPLEEL
jgi:uncharacterized protein